MNLSPQSYHCEFITPCFCAGANQAVAELRAPAIRGQVRWWFRVLGGSAGDEARLYGGTAGNRSVASAFMVRCRLAAEPPKWNPPKFNPSSDLGYLLYFAQAADKKRWNPKGALAAGTAFTLHFSWCHAPPVSEAARQLHQLAVEAFLTLGSFGLRATRGLGAFVCDKFSVDANSLRQLCQRIQQAQPGFRFATPPQPSNPSHLLRDLGQTLRELRREFPAGKGNRQRPSPLGSSNPRQASAVRLRPLAFEDGSYHILLMEAPHQKILEPSSRQTGPVLKASS